MPTDDRAKLEALPAFDDPHVQIVYRILCDTDLVPPPDEHWEGFTARHVVAALASAQAASAEPAAPTEGAQAKRTPLEALKTYEPDVVIEESRGRLTATGAAMKQQAAGRWVRLEDVCAALATRTPEPHGRTVYQLPKGEQIAANAALSGQFKQASAPGYFVQQRSTVATRTPEPAEVTDEMQSEFEPDEAGVQALRVAIEGECDGLDITDAQARAVLRYVGATIKCALTKTIRSRTRTPEPQAEQVDPTDPGHDVNVLREHVRHLERRVRQLSEPQPDSRGQAREGCSVCRGVGSVGEPPISLDWTEDEQWVRSQLQRMILSSRVLVGSDGTVTGYQIKTGALHKLIGRFAVNVPLGLPEVAASPTPDEQRAQAAQEDVEAIVDRVCNDVAELPDRNSPEDWPEAMLVTHDELAEIVRTALAGRQTL